MGTKATPNNEFLYTLQEIADMMGVSRERVRQIEKMALEKLRHTLTDKGVGYADLSLNRDFTIEHKDRP